MSASRPDPTLDMSSIFPAEPTLEEFTAFLSETPAETSINDSDATINPVVPIHTNGSTPAIEAGREMQQIVTALTGLKSELKRAGLLDKPNVQNLFRQVAEFAAVQPKKAQNGAGRELRYQRKQMSAITAQLRQMSNLDSLLKVVVKVARETLQADRAFVYRFDLGDTGKIIAESVQRGWTPALGTMPEVAGFSFDQPEEYAKQQIVAIESTLR